MSWYPRIRDLHLYIGLVLLIPLVLIGGTGVMMNHERLLGLKSEYKLPEAAKRKPKAAAAPGPLTTRDATATRHVPQLAAALAAARGAWGGDMAIEHIQLKDEPGLGLVIKVKAGREQMVTPDEIFWSVAHETVVHRPEIEKGGRNWGKFVYDLHTGQIFSRSWGFWWSDATGAAILLLSLTGIVMYVIPILKKRGKKARSTVAVRPFVARQPAVARAAVASASAEGGQS